MWAGQTQRLTAVVLEEVNGFRRVTIGLRPGLGRLVDHGGAEQVLPAPHQGGRLQDQPRALSGLPARPVRKGRPGGVYGSFRLGATCPGRATDQLGLAAWVEAVDPRARVDALAADDQRPLASEFALDLLQGGLHRLAIGRVGEVGERLVGELGNHERTLSRRACDPGTLTEEGPCRADAMQNDRARAWRGRTWLCVGAEWALFGE